MPTMIERALETAEARIKELEARLRGLVPEGYRQAENPVHGVQTYIAALEVRNEALVKELARLRTFLKGSRYG